MSNIGILFLIYLAIFSFNQRYCECFQSGWSYIYDYETKVIKIKNGLLDEVSSDDFEKYTKRYEIKMNVFKSTNNNDILKIKIKINEKQNSDVLVEFDKNTSSFKNSVKYSSNDKNEDLIIKLIVIDLLNLNKNSNIEVIMQID